MEPKSIAFYTAVAIGMLAVLGATIFPALVQAVQAATTPLTATNGSGGSDGGGAANDNGQPQKDKTTDPKKSSSSDGGGAANDNGQPQKDKTTDPKSSTTSQNDNSAQGNDNHQNEVSNGNRATSQGLTLDPSGGRVSCGSVLTESTTLTNDLNCDGTALVIGRDSVVLNLNGHTISHNGGNRNLADPTSGYNGDSDSGILISNADHVSVVGVGAIQDFVNGIGIVGSANAIVQDVALRGNDVGIYMVGSDGAQIARNNIDDNGIGVDSHTSNVGVISFNSLMKNTKEGVLLDGSDKNIVAGNNIYSSGKFGIHLTAQSGGNVIDYNNVFGSTGYDMNNADGLSPDVNNNSFGQHNNCETSIPSGLCQDNGNNNQDNGNNR